VIGLTSLHILMCGSICLVYFTLLLSFFFAPAAETEDRLRGELYLVLF